MNERFENLAEEAMVHVPGQTGLHTRGFSLAKFAELIVMQCLDIIEDEGSGEGGSVRAIHKIKRHFGINEQHGT
jgi:predicted Zn-dependent protease with MMP-like domain